MEHASSRPHGAAFPFVRAAVALAGAAALCAIFLAGCTAAPKSDNAASDARSADTIEVVASFYPMYDFAQKIGGDRVTVKNLVPAGTEPHDWEPSPQDIKDLQAADVFVYHGAGMEHWVEDALESMPEDGPTAVEASEGIELLPAAEEDHDHGEAADEHGHADEADEHDHDHDHGQYDPHAWLSPKNAVKELENVKNALVKADPAGKDVYEANYEKWAAEFAALDAEYEAALSAVPNKSIVVSHQAFGYLCDAYGLTQVPIEGMEADAEPDAKTMAEIVEFVKANNVRTIFSEELVSPKVARAIADASGASCETLNPLEGLTDEELASGADYLSVMRENLDALEKALA